MKTKIGRIFGIMLYLSTALWAMVIDNECIDDQCKDDGRIKTVSGIFDEDYLFLGNELVFSGEAEDLLFLGKILNFSGKTKLGLIALGKKLLYSGESGNGVIAGGMNVVIDGKIIGNNFIGCKSFQLTDKAEMRGNLFLGCAKGSIDGPLNGDLYAGAGELTINGVINGNVIVYGGRIIIGDKGKINGNLTYGAKEKLSDKELARVTGTVTIDEKHKFDRERMFPAKMKPMLQILIGLGLNLSFMIVGCLLLFIPVFGKLDAQKPGKKFWYTALWGLVPLLMYPAVILLCFALIVTIPLAVVLLLAGIPLLFLAYLIGTTLLGNYIATKLKWNVQKRHFHFLIGALAGTVAALIPFVNFLGFIFLSAMGWGVYLSFLFNKEVSAAAPVVAETGSVV